MKTRLSAAGATMAAAALAASVLLAVPGTARAADTATISVSIVDQYGQPAAVSLVALDAQRRFYYDGPSEPPRISSTQIFRNLPAGGYTFISTSPWSGFECFGLSPCTTDLYSASFTPVVTVAEGGAVSYTARVIMPSVTGGPALGTPLTVKMSAGYEYLQSLLAAQQDKSVEHTQQWRRNTSEIPGATGPTYTTSPTDVAKSVSVRLSPSPAVADSFATGSPVPAFTPPPVLITKARTTTKASYLGERVRVKVKSFRGAAPDGKIRLTLGKFKVKTKLTDGKATVALPAKLEPGTYTLKVSYLGSRAFFASKSKKKTLTIR